jgi:hypothetical protein
MMGGFIASDLEDTSAAVKDVVVAVSMLFLVEFRPNVRNLERRRAEEGLLAGGDGEVSGDAATPLLELSMICWSGPSRSQGVIEGIAGGGSAEVSESETGSSKIRNVSKMQKRQFETYQGGTMQGGVGASFFSRTTSRAYPTLLPTICNKKSTCNTFFCFNNNV